MILLEDSMMLVFENDFLARVLVVDRLTTILLVFLVGSLEYILYLAA